MPGSIENDLAADETDSTCVAVAKYLVKGWIDESKRVPRDVVLGRQRLEKIPEGLRSRPWIKR